MFLIIKQRFLNRKYHILYKGQFPSRNFLRAFIGNFSISIFDENLNWKISVKMINFGSKKTWFRTKNPNFSIHSSIFLDKNRLFWSEIHLLGRKNMTSDGDFQSKILDFGQKLGFEKMVVHENARFCPKCSIKIKILDFGPKHKFSILVENG